VGPLPPARTPRGRAFVRRPRSPLSWRESCSPPPAAATGIHTGSRRSSRAQPPERLSARRRCTRDRLSPARLCGPKTVSPPRAAAHAVAMPMCPPHSRTAACPVSSLATPVLAAPESLTRALRAARLGDVPNGNARPPDPPHNVEAPLHHAPELLVASCGEATQQSRAHAHAQLSGRTGSTPGPSQPRQSSCGCSRRAQTACS